MQVSRRAFLRSLAVAAAGMTIDPERLLWRPGAKTIVVMNGDPFWLKDLIDGPGPAPDEPEYEIVWAFVRKLYLEWWKSEAFNGVTK